jgi:hypothetical protein
MAPFKSMATTANMAGTMFPGTIVPIIVEGPRPKGYASTFIARVDPREGKKWLY